MNFERGIDSKRGMKVGIKQQALKLNHIWANMESGTHTLTIEQTKKLLNNIDIIFDEDHKKLFRYTAVYKIIDSSKKFTRHESARLEEMRGKWLKFNNEFYKIPK